MTFCCDARGSACRWTVTSKSLTRLCRAASIRECGKPRELKHFRGSTSSERGKLIRTGVEIRDQYLSTVPLH
jgi:hypothetical protein